MPIRLFISHSSQDEDLTKALISLLESKFYFNEREIRCTSLQPYRLPSGSQTATRLKQELQQADLVLCVLTPVSTESEWVGFELGAAWGMPNKWVVPMLVGLDYGDVPDPLRELSVLKATESESIYQLLDEIGERLNWQSRSSARVDTAVRNLVSIAEQQEQQQYEVSDFPLSDFDVEDFFSLDIIDELEIGEPAALECIAFLMSNIGEIELVDGQTGRDCTASLLQVYREAFLSPSVPCVLTAEKSATAFKPTNLSAWQGLVTWDSGNATHYQLTARLTYSDAVVQHTFEFTVEHDEDGSLSAFINGFQVRWRRIILRN